MANEIQTILKMNFEKLPSDVKRAVLSVDFEQHLARISQKNALQVDQMTALENETMFILLGIEHPRNYISNLARELTIDVAKARAIAQDVNEKIFRPIRDSLKQVHEITEESGSRNQEVGIRNQENVYPVSRMEKRVPGANVQQTTGNLQQTTDMPASVKGYGEAMQDTSHLIDHEGFHDQQRSTAINHQPTIIGHQSSANDHRSSVTETAPSNLPVVENEEALTHDQVLAELEYHSKAGKNIVEERLQGTFAIPSTKTEHKEVPVLKKESARTDVSVDKKPDEQKTNPYKETDPYREHVE